MFKYEKPDNLVEWFTKAVHSHGKNPLFGTKNGLLTQTMKLKRRKVIEKYRSEIDHLYR